MGTFELLIVFAALMAVISLVAIAIDWVGRPLKNRRFIPRIYRYEDEVEPTAAPILQTAPANAAVTAAPVAQAHPVQPVPVQGPPMAPGPPIVVTAPPVAAPPPASMAPASPPIVKPDVTTVAAELAPVPPAADAAPSAHPDSVSRPSTPATPSTSAFQDTIGASDPADPADPGDTSDAAGAAGASSGAGTAAASAKPRGIAETVHTQSAASWAPGMPLDARVNDANPSPDEKAQRFWMATGDAAGTTTHFDDVNLARMAQGKAPTRRNPRTGDVEAMELVGLRAASHRSDVRMKWPDETVDPWSAS